MSEMEHHFLSRICRGDMIADQTAATANRYRSDPFINVSLGRFAAG